MNKQSQLMPMFLLSPKKLQLPKIVNVGYQVVRVEKNKTASTTVSSLPEVWT